jgi:hypothetical protein
MPANDVQEAVKILVTQFIPLKMTDLQEWEQNPEQWVNEEDAENDQWEYELRVSYNWVTVYRKHRLNSTSLVVKDC